MKKLLIIFIAFVAITGVASAGLTSQLGVLDLTANEGLNPATGAAWQAGDQYRLVFITSERVDPNNSAADNIAYWNDAVQTVANNATAHDLSSVTWNIIGSTADVDARDNTATNPAVDGTGHAIFHMDGSSVIENNFDDLWDGAAPQNMDLFDEDGVALADSTANPYPITGTNWDGEAHGSLYLKDTSADGAIRQGHPTAEDGRGWIDGANVGASWDSASAQNVYGMSESLTVIPEPGTYMFLLLGALGIILRRPRRK